MTGSRVDRFRRRLIVVCLAAALVLVVRLGYEAITASGAQRRAAEGVLGDYAALAAEQYARNITVVFDYEWCLPVLRLLTSGADVDADTQVAGQSQQYRLGDVAAARFTLTGGGDAHLVPIGSGGLEDLGGLGAAVSKHAMAHYQPGWPYAALRFAPPDAQPPVLVVYHRPDRDDAPIVGFVATPGVLRSFLAEAVGVYALLPATLTRAAGDAPVVHVTALDDSGGALFEAGPDGPAAASASFDLDARRAAMRAVATIPASSAPLLIAGGLPYSRLPIVGGLLVLTVILIGAGALLWRRERELIALREQFVAGASHELRTPLAQIRMFAETLHLQRTRSGEEATRSLAVIDREARRLSMLVENLLQFSSPARQARRFVPEPLDLVHVADDAAARFEPLAAARGTRVVVESDRSAGAVMVLGDRDLLGQVLVNLLDNAVKYGPAGQVVRVEVASEAGEAVLAVTDQGPGVPDGEAALVWQRFWRGAAAGTVTGTGIGLALVREIIERHHGRVSVGAGSRGGARFEVRLPSRPA